MSKIGIDARLTAYRTGGISTYIRRIIMALAQIDDPHRYIVLRSRKSGEQLASGLRHVPVWTPPHHRLERIALSVELLRHRLDLLHSPDFIPPHYGARRHIITVHDLTFMHYPQYLTADSRRYYNDQIRAAVTHADHILCDSEATKRDLINMLNVPTDKLTVHPLGVDESFHPLTQEDIAPVLSKYGLKSGYFLSLGTIEPRKNINGILDAYRILRDEYHDAPPLVFAGKMGWMMDDFQQQINRRGLVKHVRWLRHVDTHELPALYNAAIAQITLSFYEGFGLPALEAMACGTIPIVSNRSSLPEITGDTGITVDPENPTEAASAMSRVLNDTEWRSEESSRVIERAKQFSWTRCAEIVLDTYNSLLSTL